MTMPGRNQPLPPGIVLEPAKKPEIIPPLDPEEPLPPPEDPDIVPDEDPFENPPYEVPEPGEGP